ncbi:MAG: sensor histidine kinase [Anaerolineales bacterium]
MIAAVTHKTAMMDDLEKLGELGNTTLGQSLSNTYSNKLTTIQELSESKSAENIPSEWIVQDLLDRPIQDFTVNTPVLRVKIFSLTGKTIYSTNNSQVADNNSLDPNAISVAKSGSMISEIRRYHHFVKNDGAEADLMIVTTYMPIKSKGEIVGVLELYNDISIAYAKIKDGLDLFIAVLFLLGLLFFYTVIYFVQKAEKIIETKREKEKRDHEYLKIAFKKATESTRAKSEFLASMSHELRTPLNAIIGYSEILLEEHPKTDTLDIEDELSNIRSSGMHLKILIEEILDHAKIESGVIDIQTRNCHINDIIESCVAYVTPDANKNENTITLALSGDIQEINTDDVKVKRVILNLISNANKFTNNGTISVSTQINDHNIVVKVEDTGIGIADTDIQKIFEPFTQIDNSYSRQHGGTGLGLTISKEYANALGGKITLSSQKDVGTIVEFIFPYCIAKQLDISEAQSKKSPAA